MNRVPQWPRVGSLTFEVVYGLSYVSPALPLSFTLMDIFKEPLEHVQATDVYQATTGPGDRPTISDVAAATEVPTAGGVPAASDVPVAASTSSYPIGAEILLHGADPITAE